MPIEIYLAPQLFGLAEILGEVIQRELKADPFFTLQILTPNRNLSRYLELYLAREKGICANLNFDYLDSFLLNHCKERFYPKDRAPEILAKTGELLILYSLLGSPEAGPLAKYWESKEDTEVRSLRRMELAERLLSLFGGYERHQSEMIENWLSNNWSSSLKDFPKGRELAKAEALLYRSFHESCRQTKKLRNYEFFRRLLQEEKDRNTKKNSAKLLSLHLFGFSQLSELHIKLISVLSKTYRIIYYLTHPPNLSCKKQIKAWSSEDLLPLGKNPGWMQSGSFVLPLSFFEPASRMLALFQKFHPEADWYVKAGGKPSSANKPGTLLFLLKESLRQHGNFYCDEATKEIQQNKDDASIQLAVAPGKRREIEAIYQSILHHLEKDPELSLNDIAILLPNVAAYRSAITSVFDSGGRESKEHLPYNLTDFTSEEESLYLNAQATLFQILLGEEPGLEELSSLFQNPLFLAAWGAKSKYADYWLHWMESLSIFGINESINPIRNWKEARNRLLLGLVIENPSSDSQFLGLHPFRLSSLDAAEALGILLGILENWEKAGLALKQASTKGAHRHRQQKNLERLAQIEYFLVTNIQIPEDEAGENLYTWSREKKVEEACLLLIRELQENKVLLKEVELPLQILFRLIQKDLKLIPASKGRYLSTGITISALQPMRPIPFRYIYIAGLNASDFPGREDTSGLNLLSQLESEKNNLSSYLSLPARNNLLFMEMILAARDGLYLSYNAHDLQKDEAKLPSSTLSALIDFIHSLAENFGQMQPGSEKAISKNHASANQGLLKNKRFLIEGTPKNGSTRRQDSSESARRAPSNMKTPPKRTVFRGALETKPPLFLFDADYEKRASKEPVSDFLYNYRIYSKPVILQEIPSAWASVQSSQLTQNPSAALFKSEDVGLKRLAYFLNYPPDAVLRYRYGLYDPLKQEEKAEPVLQVYFRNNIFQKICSNLILQAATSAGIAQGACKLDIFDTELSKLLSEKNEKNATQENKAKKSLAFQFAKETYESFSRKGEAQAHALGRVDFWEVWQFCETYLKAFQKNLKKNALSPQQSGDSAAGGSSNESSANAESPSFCFYPSFEIKLRFGGIKNRSKQSSVSKTQEKHIVLQGEVSWLVVGVNSLEMHIFVSTSVPFSEKVTAYLSLLAALLASPKPLPTGNGKEAQAIHLRAIFYKKSSKIEELSFEISLAEAKEELGRLLSFYSSNMEGRAPPEWLYPELLWEVKNKNPDLFPRFCKPKAGKEGTEEKSETTHKSEKQPDLSEKQKEEFRSIVEEIYFSSEASFPKMALTKELFEPYFSKESLLFYCRCYEKMLQKME